MIRHILVSERPDRPCPEANSSRPSKRRGGCLLSDNDAARFLSNCFAYYQSTILHTDRFNPPLFYVPVTITSPGMPLITRHAPAPQLQYFLLCILVIVHTSHCSRDANARTTQPSLSLSQQQQLLNDHDNLPHPHLETQPPHKEPKDVNQQQALDKGPQNTANTAPLHTHHQSATSPSSPQQAAHFYSPIHNPDPQPNEVPTPLPRTSSLSHPPPFHHPAQSFQPQQQLHGRQPSAASRGSDGASNATPLTSPPPTTEQSSSKVNKSTASSFKNSVPPPFDTFRMPGSNSFTFNGFPVGFGGLSVTTAGQLDDLFVRAISNRYGARIWARAGGCDSVEVTQLGCKAPCGMARCSGAVASHRTARFPL